MFNLLSLLVGLLALVLAIVGLVPLLGWVNWLALPIAAAGAALGVLSSHNVGRNLNILVLAIGAGRLMLGGGIF